MPASTATRRRRATPPAVKWSPRVARSTSLDEQTVLRGGYGALLGAVQLSRRRARRRATTDRSASRRTRSLSQSRTNPVTLTNPFPNGVAQPTGNCLGALTNLDSNISFVDQNRTAPRVQQFSVDLQRELRRRSDAHRVLRRRPQRSPRARRIERHADQHQPARSGLPGARRGAERSAARTRSSATRTCRCRCRRRRRWRARACCCRSRSTGRSTPGR